MTALRLLYSVLALALLQGCDGGLEIDWQTNLAESSVSGYKVTIDPSRLCSDITVKDENGQDVRGTRDCQAPSEACKKSGDINCYMQDGSLYGVERSALQPEHIKAGVTVGGVTGTMIDDQTYCSREGQASCVTTAQYKPADKAGLAAKIISGQSVGAVSGTMVPDLPDAANVVSSAQTGGSAGTLALCATSAQTGCVLTAQQKATETVNKADIRQGHKVGSVTGTFTTNAANCTADNKTGCVATATVPAMAKSRLQASNLLTGWTLAGQRGAVKRRPAVCSTDNQDGCVAEGSTRSIPRSHVSQGLVRSGVTIAGVLGDYPSASHPLPGSAVTGLTSGNFNSRITTSAPFEFWDATGARHQVTGTADLSRSNILTGKTIFSLAGQLSAKPDECTRDNQTGCVAVTAYPAIEASKVFPSNIRTNVVIAGKTGVYPSNGHRLSGTTGKAQLSMPAHLSSATAVEFWDSAGGYHTITGNAALTAANIRSSVNLFGVNGAAQARSSDCNGLNQAGCVAVTAYPSYQKAKLTPAVVKNNTKIGTITGSYPSAATPLDGNTAASDLTTASLGSKLQSASTFEFWDAEGTRHTATGDSDFTAANILAPIEIFGVTGDLKAEVSACQGGGILAVNCVTSTNTPSYDASVIKPEFIKKGVKVGAITGAYPSSGFPLTGSSGTVDDLTSGNFNSRMASNATFEYFDAEGNRYTSQGDGDLTAANIRDGVQLLGVTGSVTGAPKTCNQESEVGCVTTTGFKSYQHNAIDMSVIKNGVKIFGQTGSFPSVNDRLATNTGTVDLSSGNMNTLLRQTGTFEFFDRKGARHTASGSPGITAANLRKDIQLFGVTGVTRPKPGNCAAKNDSNCIANATYPALQKSLIRPEILRRGTTLVGVAGQYPSVDYPLPDNTTKDDLTSTTFGAALGSGSAVEFFDSLGNRHELTGDAQLQAGNISATKTILGVQGTFQGMTQDTRWDIKHGSNIGGTFHGRLKLNCRNLGNLGLFDHSFAEYDNIDDHNNGAGNLPSHNPWGSDAYSCNDDVFTDISVNKAGNRVACNPSDTDVTCIYKDNISQLAWRKAYGGRINYPSAKSECHGLAVTDGGEKWRVPTQKEALAAHVHGIHRLGKRHGSGTFQTSYDIWTSTRKGDSGDFWTVNMGSGDAAWRADHSNVHCVRTPPR